MTMGGGSPDYFGDLANYWYVLLVIAIICILAGIYRIYLRTHKAGQKEDYDGTK